MMKRLLGTMLSLWIAVTGLYPASARAEEGRNQTYPLDAGMYYTIKKGDTLWDLSRHFFDSPWVWPDLWEKNQQIPNPHWIYPGNRIRIYSREGLELEKRHIPGTAPTTPPAALPEKNRKPSYFNYPAIDSVGFVRTPLTPCGTVTKVITVKELISNLDMVYVQPAKNAAFACGDRFTIYRTPGAVRDPVTHARIGVQHYIVGVLEITEVARPYCMAKVIHSFRQIEDNDLLMPYQARSPKIAISDSQRGFDGRIVGVEEARELIADRDLVFIDKGQKDGVKAGQYYSVYYRPEVPDQKERAGALLPPIDLGTILVLHVEETTATGLVTAAKKTIELGKKLRTPPSL